jgi:hypothetical protein
MSVDARAHSIDMSGRTLLRKIAAGTGPKRTEVSPGNKPILDPDWNAWLATLRNDSTK